MCGDGDNVLCLERELGEVAEGHLERSCHSLEESARTRGALVVHCKVLNRAVRVDCDTLDILSADIYNCLYARVGNVYAHSVARDFGDVLVCRCDLVAAVTRTYEIGEVFNVAFEVRDGIYYFRHSGVRRESRVDFALDGGIRNHLSVFIQYNCFCVG